MPFLHAQCLLYACMVAVRICQRMCSILVFWPVNSMLLAEAYIKPAGCTVRQRELHAPFLVLIATAPCQVLGILIRIAGNSPPLHFGRASFQLASVSETYGW